MKNNWLRGTRVWKRLQMLTLTLAIPFLGLTNSSAFAQVLGEPAALNEAKTAGDRQDADLRLLAISRISVDATDKSGLSGELIDPSIDQQTQEKQNSQIPVFHNDQMGGISAIAWSGKDDVYWFLPDRGPLDGAVDWSCRVQKVRVAFDKDSEKLTTNIVASILLKDDQGRPFTGLATASTATAGHPARLDPEGIRVLENGNLVVSDEYGPRVIEFTETGEFVRELKVPGHLLVANPGASKSEENSKNESGRQSNRGMEGLAIECDGKSLVGLMQSPLLQDCFRKTMLDKPTGLNCRIPVMNLNGRLKSEYLYHLESKKNKLNEILCCGPEQYLVIERDGEAGNEAQFKKLVLISTKTATNIASVKRLPAKDIPAGVRPVSKSVLIDLLDPKWKLGGSMPEKIESLAFGPDLDAKHRLLLVASDNDFETDTQLFAFAVPKKAFESSPVVKLSRHRGE